MSHEFVDRGVYYDTQFKELIYFVRKEKNYYMFAQYDIGVEQIYLEQDLDNVVHPTRDQMDGALRQILPLCRGDEIVSISTQAVKVKK